MLFQCRKRAPYIFQQYVAKVAAYAVANQYALDDEILPVRRHRIGRNLPSARAQTVGKIVQAEVATSAVTLASSTLPAVRHCRRGLSGTAPSCQSRPPDIARFDNRPFAPWCIPRGPAGQNCNTAHTIWPAGAGKIQGKRRHVAAEVIDVKISPPAGLFRSRQITQPQPSGARPYLWPEALIDFTRGRRKSHSMSGWHRRVRENPRWRRIHVNRNVQPGFLLQFVKRIAAIGLDRLVAAVERDPKRGHHADGIFVAPRQHFRPGPSADGPSPSALRAVQCPNNGRICASRPAPGRMTRFGLSAGFPGGPAPLAPAPFHGHAAEHRRLARTGGGASHGVDGVRRIPQFATMCTQRFSISAVCGYSSLSIMFLSMQSSSS